MDDALDANPMISGVTEVEVPAAIHRRRLDGIFDDLRHEESLQSAAAILRGVVTLELTESVKAEAVELASKHRIRSLDAIQVASAVVAARTSRRRGSSLAFLTADRRQAEVARAIFGERRTTLLDPL